MRSERIAPRRPWSIIARGIGRNIGAGSDREVIITSVIKINCPGKGLDRDEVAMRVHADVLKMAATKARRDLILWLHARTLFFEFSQAVNFQLVRQRDHQDARFLVSLFPNGAPATREEAGSVFAARNDARCQCWAEMSGMEPKAELLLRSAEAGYALGQTRYALDFCSGDGQIGLLEKAAAQGEALAMWRLGCRHWEGRFCAADKKQGRQWWLEAALLGEAWSQYRLAHNGFPKDSVLQFVWLRRAAVQPMVMRPYSALIGCAAEQLKLFDNGASGRKVFEIGYAVAERSDRKAGVTDCQVQFAAERALQLYRQWSSESKTAIWCWIWMARDLGIVRDIRLIIADLVWSERCVWSEKRKAST